MKTLHINTETAWRGGERQTLYLVSGLRDRGVEAHLVCQPGSPLAQRALAANVNVHPVSMRGEADILAVSALRRVVRGFGYDLIHSHTSHAHTLAFWASAGVGVSRLVTRRVEYSIFRNSFFRLNRIKYRHMADAYIAISGRIKKVLVADGVPGQMIRVIHSGVDPEPDLSGAERIRAEFNIERDAPVILSVAHLAPEKGHDTLLRAMKTVARRISSIRLMILGDGSCRPKLEALTEKLDLRERVIFAGFREDVSAFYGLADGFVSSSLAEGLGTSVLDALAAGIPVVATAVGGIPEFIENGRTGILVPAGEPRALADGITELLERPDSAHQFTARGREVVRDLFSVGKMVDDTVGLYRELLSRELSGLC